MPRRHAPFPFGGMQGNVIHGVMEAYQSAGDGLVSGKGASEAPLGMPYLPLNRPATPPRPPRSDHPQAPLDAGSDEDPMGDLGAPVAFASLSSPRLSSPDR